MGGITHSRRAEITPHQLDVAIRERELRDLFRHVDHAEIRQAAVELVGIDFQRIMQIRKAADIREDTKKVYKRLRRENRKELFLKLLEETGQAGLPFGIHPGINVTKTSKQ